MTYAEQLVSNLLPLIDPILDCYGSAVGYQQGVLCYACEQDWSTNYDAETDKLTLTSSTCDSVYNNGCEKAFTDLNSIWPKELDLLIKFLQNTPQPWSIKTQQEIAGLLYLQNTTSGVPLCEILDPSQSSCKELLCNDMLHGTEIMFPRNGKSFLTSLPIFGPLFLSLEYDFNQAVLRTVHSIISRTSLSLSDDSDESSNVNGSNTMNVYVSTSGAYAPYSIGCEAQLSGYACVTQGKSDSGGGGGLSSLAIIAVILIVVGIVYGIVYGILWYFKNAHRFDRNSQNAPYSTLQGSTQ